MSSLFIGIFSLAMAACIAVPVMFLIRSNPKADLYMIGIIVTLTAILFIGLKQ